MSGGLIACVGYILYSTVVVYTFNFMTYPKCSTYAPLCFSVVFYSIYNSFLLVFITKNQWFERARKSYLQAFVENTGFAL